MPSLLKRGRLHCRTVVAELQAMFQLRRTIRVRRFRLEVGRAFPNRVDSGSVDASALLKNRAARASVLFDVPIFSRALLRRRAVHREESGEEAPDAALRRIGLPELLAGFFSE